MRYLGFEPGGGAYQHGPLWGKTSILHQNLMYLIIGNFKTLHEINSIIETVKNPRGCQISPLDRPVRSFSKKSKTKYFISVDSFNFVPVVSTSFVLL